jgi:hypothetical protein
MMIFMSTIGSPVTKSVTVPFTLVAVGPTLEQLEIINMNIIKARFFIVKLLWLNRYVLYQL